MAASHESSGQNNLNLATEKKNKRNASYSQVFSSLVGCVFLFRDGSCAEPDTKSSIFMNGNKTCGYEQEFLVHSSGYEQETMLCDGAEFPQNVVQGVGNEANQLKARVLVGKMVRVHSAFFIADPWSEAGMSLGGRWLAHNAYPTLLMTTITRTRHQSGCLRPS